MVSRKTWGRPRERHLCLVGQRIPIGDGLTATLRGIEDTPEGYRLTFADDQRTE